MTIISKIQFGNSNIGKNTLILVSSDAIRDVQSTQCEELELCWCSSVLSVAMIKYNQKQHGEGRVSVLASRS